MLPVHMLPVAVAALAIGVLAGSLRGGSLSRLQLLRVRHAWLVAIAFGVQVLLFVGPLGVWLGDGVAPVLMATNLALLLMVALNLHLPGLKLIGLGLAANTLVMLLNGGYMPVSEPALRAAGLDWRVDQLAAQGHSDKSRLVDATTRLPVLGDVIPVPPINKVLSIGDLLVAAGAAWLLAAGMTLRSSPSQTTPMAVSTNDGRFV